MKDNNHRKQKKKKEEIILRLPKDYPWKILSALAEDLCEYLYEDERLSISNIIRQRDVEKLIALSEEWSLQSMAPLDLPFENLKSKHQLASLLKKFPFSIPNVDRKASAAKKFFYAEEACARFNTLGVHTLARGDAFSRDLVGFCQRYISTCIDVIPPEVSELTLRSRHGPGATLSTSHGRVSSYFKFRDWPYDCTTGARDIAISFIISDERWWGVLEDSFRKCFRIDPCFILDQKKFRSEIINTVPGNRITTVPKTAMVDRTIAIEPTLNLMLQLGVDGFVRKSLLRKGIDLSDQSLNQRLARQGSINGNLATVDLSMASDTISTALVKLLFPPMWYNLLMRLRSPSGEFLGKTVLYNKLSSMGNGYTFAIETLIFSACCAFAAKGKGYEFGKHMAVYGDDIIIPSDCYDKLSSALHAFGFYINSDKSFNKGPIRESCGTDWHNGRNIRPISLHNPLSRIDDLICFRNLLQRHMDLYWGLRCSKSVALLDKWIPSNYSFYGPISDEEFSTYVHSYKPTTFNNYVNGVWRFKRYVRKGSITRVKDFGFRKLMHSLTGPLPVNSWDRKLDVSGSRFVARKRNAFRYTIQRSATSIWWSEYRDITTQV